MNEKSDIVERIQYDMGWTDDTIMMFALRFITAKKLDDEFNDYVQLMADSENEETGV